LLHVGDTLVGDDVPAPFRPGPLLDGPGQGFPVPGQPRQRGIHLAVAQRPPLPEVSVVVALQVIPMAGPALKQPQQRQRNTHIRETTSRVVSRIVVDLVSWGIVASNGPESAARSLPPPSRRR